MDKKATDLRKRASYDLERDEWLKAQGFQIFRFWNNQVFDGIEAVKETIDPALLKHTPHLGPPPQGGGNTG